MHLLKRCIGMGWMKDLIPRGLCQLPFGRSCGREAGGDVWRAKTYLHITELAIQLCNYSKTQDFQSGRNERERECTRSESEMRLREREERGAREILYVEKLFLSRQRFWRGSRSINSKQKHKRRTHCSASSAGA